MTRTWTQMARSALDGARAWRAALRQRGIAERDLGFTAPDFMVLNLLLDLDEATDVVCADQRLREVLAAVWTEAEPLTPARRVLAAHAGDRHLLLLRLREAGQRADGPATAVVYGLGQGIALADLSPEVRSAGLRPLSSTAPALWQCGLALLVPEGGTAPAEALVEKLRQSMRGEWIDPLALYERVQQLTATLNGLGHAQAIDPEAKLDRIAELEQELASLKRMALVSQHLLLLQAAERDSTAA